ncbi:apolipoprotein N-acyltransferase [Ningiella sp. W23]|uniref:apolipoprotein N-acyltransferase n=1 Tax=Ningiella sp. W23 TaxID=3023715 RepID=UPI003756ACC7
MTFAYAPFSYWWLPFFLLPAWLCVTIIRNEKPFFNAWLFGLGFFGAGISWVHVSIATFGGVHIVFSILLMLLLCGYLALYPALFAFILKRYFAFRLWPLAVPLLWLVTEWIRAHFLTGFPWLSIGYSQADGPFAMFYSYIGEIGVSAVMLFLAAVTANVLIKRNQATIISFTTVALVTSTSIFLFSPSAEKDELANSTPRKTFSVALVQGNIEQSIRWRPEQDRPTMEKYLRLTEQAWDADIILWPEAAVPRLEILAGDYLSLLDDIATETESALITGVVDVNIQNQYAYNNLIALGLDTSDANSMPYQYMHNNRFSKHHLLPIGEFVPFENLLRPLAPIFDLPMSSFSRGDYVQENLRAKGLKFAPAICFEIAFPNQVRANIFADTSAIVTVSNDAWFGDSHGPHQHLEIAKVRAMEFGLPVIRATNTGVTAAYDHNGNLLGKLPQFKDDVLRVDVPIVTSNTFYAKHGNIAILVISALSMLLALFLKRHQQ